MILENYTCPDGVKFNNYDFYDMSVSPKYVFGVCDPGCEKLSTVIPPKRSVSGYASKNLAASGGTSVMFETDSPTLLILCKMEEDFSVNNQNIGVAARRGFSVMVRPEKQEWGNLDCYGMRNRFESFFIRTSEYNDIKNNYTVAINMPIFNTVLEFIVGVEKKSVIKTVDISRKSPIAFLGTSATFGVGVTSPSFVISNIIMREKQRECFNFGINEVYYYYQFLVDQIQKLKCKTIVLEIANKNCEINKLTERLPQFLDKLVYCKNLILWHSPYFEPNDKIRQEIKKAVEKGAIYLHNKQSDTMLEYSTISANYINDYGNYLLAKELLPLIED